MVIVRESPRKAAPQSDQQWPPKSPLAALLSSPSGRKRYESRYNRNSTSPSPAKRRRTDAVTPERQLASEDDEEDEEDEDEETLQLKLKAIEAKLKLKKLQRAKAKSSSQASFSEHSSELAPSSRPGTALDYSKPRASRLDPGFRPTAPSSERRVNKPPEPRSNVLVPVSPVRKARAVADPTSPARVILGIDKGLRAQDVSLKRPSNPKVPALARSSSQKTASGPTLKSFGERIADLRTVAKETEAKEERIKQARTTGFGVNKESSWDAPRPVISRSDSLLRKGELGQKASHAPAEPRPVFRAIPDSMKKVAYDRALAMSKDDAEDLEPYSGFHLSKRRMDKTELAQALSGKEQYAIPRLLKEITGPTYDPPDCESDYVVFGIIASKSSPLDHRNASTTKSTSDAPARSKFMVLRLTDLTWELDLYLFDTGFESFWKLVPGTIIAVLNPGILPPKNKDTGAFSLKLTSSEDTVLEIGSSKHLRFCSAIKSDGVQCTQWIDARKTEVCEFHLALKVDKARKGRMEFNTMVGQGARGSSTHNSNFRGRGGGRGGRGGNNGLVAEGRTYNRELHEMMYVAPKELGFSTTRLLDDNDADVNAWQRGMSREDMQRKRAKAIAKEKELGRKLSELGSSAGAEYLRPRASDGSAGVKSSQSVMAPPEPVDALSLGLLGKKAEDVVLASKRKRGPDSGSANSAPMGWGGHSKRGLMLSREKSPLKSARRDPEVASPKKKARFMLADKGLREPGRESLGNVKPPTKDDSSSDDGLEIV
ncbi:hypothetical protein BT63DRAFT_482697 [Microthyrium microscopicum]|uniref:Uncharacterized protein n=1 Tax=Microthyrium microscopicum TaxID=703497 RepID=A0A6A6U2H5_9PEZI|nr:hypothetical protein BT63DRAFT_482697 [Microthyrium microscopicum]